MKTFIDTFLHLWVDMLPWLLLGFVIAFLCSLFLTERWMRKHLGGKGWTPIVKASIFGLPFPICSCGVLVVALALRKNGARRAPVCAFLASTPQSGSDAVLLSLPILGPVLTGLRFVSAILSGLFVGALIRWFGHPQAHPQETKDLSGECASVCACHHHDAQHKHTHGEHHHHEFLPWSKRIKDAARYAFYHLPKDILGLLLAGSIVATVIACYTPHNALAGYPLILTYLLAIIIGLPTYTCSIAMIPIAAELIFHAGVSPGATFIFLACAPTLHVGSIFILWKQFGLRTVLLLIAGILTVAISLALVIDGPLRSHLHLPEQTSESAQHALQCAHEHHAHDGCHHGCSHTHE
jgi:uncharacterized membrane protein YraQ (UPF0718 family)